MPIYSKAGQQEKNLPFITNLPEDHRRNRKKNLAAGGINYICTFLRDEALQESDSLALENGATTDNYSEETIQGLGYYPPPPPRQHFLRKIAQCVGLCTSCTHSSWAGTRQGSPRLISTPLSSLGRTDPIKSNNLRRTISSCVTFRTYGQNEHIYKILIYNMRPIYRVTIDLIKIIKISERINKRVVD